MDTLFSLTPYHNYDRNPTTTIWTYKIKQFAKKYQIQSIRYKRAYETTFSETGIHKRLVGWRRETL
jgi:hypothetical protein